MVDVLNSDTAYDVMITCPNTGKAVVTGMVVELNSWAVLELPPQKSGCPECATIHAWEKADAWLHKERSRRQVSA